MMQHRRINSSKQPPSAYITLGTGSASLAGRVSFTLALKGPCCSINTVCSSSLVALDYAVLNLRAGLNCSGALVAGVNLILHSLGFLAYGQVLATNGKCKTFDISADGLGRSDAATVLRLSATTCITLQQSELHLISGSAVNHDGRSASLAAPNGPSQALVLQAAITQCPSPSKPVGIETHGTGTALGDPIEVGALDSVFATGHISSLPLVLGALKSQQGHSEGAAGLMGVLKATLLLTYQAMSPNFHLCRINPKLPLHDFLFMMPSVVTPNAKLPDESVGISSFGMTGTNAHTVLSSGDCDRIVHLLQEYVYLRYTKTHFPWLHYPDVTAKEPKQQMPDVGIQGFEYYAPSLCCYISDIEELHGCPGRYSAGRGQQSVGFCSDDEDAVSMAMSVFQQLYENMGTTLSEIGRLEVGTESQVDRAKSIKTFLMAMFEDKEIFNIEGADTYNACYGGTNAVFSTVSKCLGCTLAALSMYSHCFIIVGIT